MCSPTSRPPGAEGPGVLFQDWHCRERSGTYEGEGEEEGENGICAGQGEDGTYIGEDGMSEGEGGGEGEDWI